MVRFKGENVKTTNQHLNCIVTSLFPKSFKALTPKDIPLNIFVKIIHFISQVKHKGGKLYDDDEMIFH